MSLTGIKFQEPVIYLRAFSQDLHCPSPASHYKYIPICNALLLLSLYKPITHQMTLGLNVVRALPSFAKTFNQMYRRQFDPSQMMNTAYYAAVIGLTLLNPVYGMLAVAAESLYLVASDLYQNFQTMEKVVITSYSLGIFVYVSQLSLFFTSNPMNVYLTTISAITLNVIKTIHIVTNEEMEGQQKYLEIADVLLRSAVFYYKHKAALNSISISSSI